MNTKFLPVWAIFLTMVVSGCGGSKGAVLPETVSILPHHPSAISAASPSIIPEASNTPITIFKGELKEDYRGGRQASIEYDPKKGIYYVHYETEKKYPNIKLYYIPETKILPEIISEVNYEPQKGKFSYALTFTNRLAKAGEITGKQQNIYSIVLYYSKGVEISNLNGPRGWFKKDLPSLFDPNSYLRWDPRGLPNHGVVPNQSLSGFVFESTSPPDINEAYLYGIEGNGGLSSRLDEFPEPLSTEVDKILGNPKNQYVVIKTISPSILKSIEPSYLISRLISLEEEAFQLKWHNQSAHTLLASGLSKLNNKLTKYDYKSAEQNIKNLIKSLSSFKASGVLGYNSYSLLVPNLEFLNKQMISPDNRVLIPKVVEIKRNTLRECKHNLNMIGQAIDKYYMSNNHYGKFPENLSVLVQEGCIKEIPQCSEGGSYVYDNSTTNYELAPYVTISCTGNHKGLPQGYPKGQSVGNSFLLIENP